jgi:TPR repeat protein
MCSLRSVTLFLCGLTVLGTAVPHVAAQQREQPDSPVFKRRYTSPPPLLKQSDALYEIWQAFLVSRKASAGDPLAQHELGVRYMLGRGIEADTLKAAYWFQQASEHDMLSSRFNLAILWYHGWGVSWNPFESFKAFLSCAEAGMNEAQYVIGLYYTENLVMPRDYVEALEWVRKAAAGGYAPAKETLPELEKAVARQNAQTVAGEDSSSFPLAVFAASDDTTARQATQALVKSVLLGGDPELRRALGLATMLDEDVGVDSLRLQGIVAAAETGSPEALAVLGRNREKGIGADRDVVDACGYYIRAIRMDWPRAAELLWTLAHEQGVVREIRNKARRGDLDAQFVWVALLGLGYESVLFQEEALLTPAQAIQLLRKGAEHDHAPSMNELALCYFSGRWVPTDLQEAKRLWSRALALGSREADIRLAVIGVQHPEDSTQLKGAISVLERAAGDGSILAEVALAYCYEHGVGVTARPSEAVRLYRIAARRGSQDAYRALRRLHDDLRPGEARFVIDDR